MTKCRHSYLYLGSGQTLEFVDNQTIEKIEKIYVCKHCKIKKIKSYLEIINGGTSYGSTVFRCY